MKFVNYSVTQDRNGPTYWRGEYRTARGKLLLVEGTSLVDAMNQMAIQIERYEDELHAA